MDGEAERASRVQLNPDAGDHWFGELANQDDVAEVERWDHAAVIEDDGTVRRLGMPPFHP